MLLISNDRSQGRVYIKKGLFSKIFDWATAFYLTPFCLAILKAQSSHGLKVLVTWISMALAVAQVIDFDGWPSSIWRSLIFFLWRVLADCALSLVVFCRNLTPATQPSWVMIQWSKMILPLEDSTTMLCWWLFEILFPWKSSNVREYRFALTLRQNFTGHRVRTHSVPSTCHKLMQSFPFFVAGIFQELPWIN